ncbi:MAG: DNA-binding response regulator [Paenibacillaceae bacterium]|nr:DNA-binding response regulator [Paenibacillaceae bacterium]
MNKSKIMIVDDHPLMAEATKQLLQQIDNLSVTSICRTGSECLGLVAQETPDLVLLDFLLPDTSGADVAEQIKKQWPDVRVVMFTGADVSTLVPRLMEARVNGILSKEVSPATLQRAIMCVLDGLSVLPSSYSFQLPLARPIEGIDLTKDEVRIMSMVVKGNTQEQIAEQVHMSKRSIDNYQRKIYEKLGVKGRAQAIEVFVRTKYHLSDN